MQGQVGVMKKTETANNEMLFISHSTKDKEYIHAFVDLLEYLGLREDDIVCSSYPGYGIPVGNNIYDWLADKFQTFDLHVIYALSENYYQSAASLNEMGAAWVLKKKWDAILLPDFNFDDIRGCIDRDQISIKLDDDEFELKHRLGELKNRLVAEFGLRPLKETGWEKRRDEFIEKVNAIKENKKREELATGDNSMNKADGLHQMVNEISKDEGIFLVYAACDPGSDGQIMVMRSISSDSVSAGKWDFVDGGSTREFARWNAVVRKLEYLQLIERTGIKDQIYRVTYQGYQIADEIKDKWKIDVTQSPDVYL